MIALIDQRVKTTQDDQEKTTHVKERCGKYKTQIQFSEEKHTMKSILEGFNNRLHIAEEKIYELEDSNKKMKTGGWRYI